MRHSRQTTLHPIPSKAAGSLCDAAICQCGKYIRVYFVSFVRFYANTFIFFLSRVMISMSTFADISLLSTAMWTATTLQSRKMGHFHLASTSGSLKEHST